MPPHAVEHGINAVKWAWGKVAGRPIRGPEGLVIGGAILVGALAYSLWRDNRGSKSKPYVDTSAIRVTTEERERYIAGIREQIQEQLGQRAQAIERFLA